MTDNSSGLIQFVTNWKDGDSMPATALNELKTLLSLVLPAAPYDHIDSSSKVQLNKLLKELRDVYIVRAAQCLDPQSTNQKALLIHKENLRQNRLWKELNPAALNDFEFSVYIAKSYHWMLPETRQLNRILDEHKPH
ncbi:MAG: hypothetical protein ABL903_04230 [Methylococcales bacterium]